MHRSVKHYLPSDGFSCVFRQWRAESHCRFIHGYAIGIRLVFASETLDIRNWVADFGSFKSLKGTFEHLFDHTTLVAEDDPKLETFRQLEKEGLCQLRIIPASGCESMADLIANITDTWLLDAGYKPRVWLEEVYVYEHEKNGAYANLDLIERFPFRVQPPADPESSYKVEDVPAVVKLNGEVTDMITLKNDILIWALEGPKSQSGQLITLEFPDAPESRRTYRVLCTGARMIKLPEGIDPQYDFGAPAIELVTQ